MTDLYPAQGELVAEYFVTDREPPEGEGWEPVAVYPPCAFQVALGGRSTLYKRKPQEDMPVGNDNRPE
jgi:hypothetical protein